jgi:Predicted transcriptional regulators
LSISSDLIRGHTDTILLACLNRSDSYGYRIGQDITQHTDGKFELKEATLYSAFRRLEKEGLIRSYWGNEDDTARRRYYSITEQGRTVYAENQTQWQQAKALLDKLISWED